MLMGGAAGKHPSKNREQEKQSRIATAGPLPLSFHLARVQTIPHFLRHDLH